MAVEVFNGVVMRTRPGLYSGTGIDPRPRVCFRELNQIPCELNFRELKFFPRSLRRRIVGEISAFDDKRHMEYYNCCTEERKEEKKKKKEKAGWKGVSEKKRVKLVKDLAKNLNMLSELGFGLDTDEAKVKTISEAALVLQAHLEHLKAEGNKLKKKGEMACLEAQRMSTVMDDSSSSSSSESSDSECDDDDGAVNMSILRNKMAAERIVVESMGSEGHETMATSPVSLAALEQQAEAMAIKEAGVEQNYTSMDTSGQLKRVEVCVGGKCKKMGAHVLMEEFQNVLGAGGSVVGCKCMGKCKTAPNVRIVNAGEEGGEDDSVRSPSNPLCLGVGLDDVGFIVANYFGSEQRHAGVGVSLHSPVSPSASYL